VWEDIEVAIKVIRAQAQEHEHAWFEASVMQDLDHPGIIKCYDWVSTQAGTVIVMHLCSGGSLQSAIDGGHFQDDGSCFTGQPDVQRVLQCAVQIARGVRHLHDHDIIHADLNGNNVLFDGCGVVKIADFGLSRLLHNREIESDEFGTVTHTPRELLVDGALSKKVDVYSFGVLLWEMLSARRAYAGLRYPDIIASKVRDDVHWCVSHSVPACVTRIVDQCTQRDPASRPDFPEIEGMLVIGLESCRQGT
jgi:serine/threonine protein kinase